ncbi:virion structural protein [Pectobacterium phage vB_PcaM_CBB]|uniref:Structural protein n=1 Tax=Pectobacterium phage vB_PcaM_CBB TaxID=2772511 RepID=A0A1L2CV54_9CAUD|nr:virion structural protein [Pectobacterium phage vB_PcaM_CBB]AMM43898.1 structural protein [Pectobacterium phage vB_PcaM_CBB]
MTKRIYERALRPLVLKDLIHPIISVDEYTPKIDESNIVVLFQVLDNFDAAYDLSSFIERSPVDVIDTEAAETPNVDGRYQVFVEFERNGEFPAKLIALMKSIENICPDPGWKLQMYGVNDPIDLDIDEITNDMELVNEEELKEFFDFAAVNVEIVNESIKIKSVYGTELHYSKGSGIVNESYVKGLLHDDTSLDSTRLSAVLGENYDVLKSGSEYIVGINGKYIVLR